MHRKQLAIAVASLVLAALYAVGATQIAKGTGYSGIGPAFLPWVIAALLALCGVLLAREALTGGFRNFEPEATPAGGIRWRAFAIASGGLLVNAALITRIGFTVSCALLFAIVAFAFGSRGAARNLVLGIAIALPVFWLFNKVLGLNLPALLASGWV